MASAAMTSPPISYEEDEELSDEQIQQLLEEAKARLTASAEHDQRVSARAQSSGRLIPRLQTITPHAPYIHEKDGIAIADPKLLISAEQRKLAESLPTIEPAGSSKKMVRTLHNPRFRILHEENISHYIP
jgi:hypothetical protein